MEVEFTDFRARREAEEADRLSRQYEHRKRILTAIVAIAILATMLSTILYFALRHTASGQLTAYGLTLAFTVGVSALVGHELLGLVEASLRLWIRIAGIVGIACVPLLVELFASLLMASLEPSIDFASPQLVIAISISVLPVIPVAAFLIVSANSHASYGRTAALSILFALYATTALATIPVSFRLLSVGWPAIAVLILLMAVVYAADTGAFYVGRRCGKRKLAPSISPNKTWEGLLGGIATVLVLLLIPTLPVAAAASIGFGTFEPGTRWPFWLAFSTFMGIVAGFGLAVAVIGTLGDLFASKLKRLAGVKDFGNLFPGHGGLLDRIDSLLPSLMLLPTIAYFAFY